VMEPFWTAVSEAVLRRGELLPNCWIPEFPADFADCPAGLSLHWTHGRTP
jgi:hypothetical protein